MSLIQIIVIAIDFIFLIMLAFLMRGLDLHKSSDKDVMIAIEIIAVTYILNFIAIC